MDELPKDPFAWISAAVGSAVVGGLWLRTKLSRDATAIAGDRAEVDMIDRLTTENRELRASLNEVTAERNRLYREVGEMVGGIRALEASQKLMEGRIVELTKEVTSLHEALERTGHERRNNQL